MRATFHTRTSSMRTHEVTRAIGSPHGERGHHGSQRPGQCLRALVCAVDVRVDRRCTVVGGGNVKPRCLRDPGVEKEAVRCGIDVELHHRSSVHIQGERFEISGAVLEDGVIRAPCRRGHRSPEKPTSRPFAANCRWARSYLECPRARCRRTTAPCLPRGKEGRLPRSGWPRPTHRRPRHRAPCPSIHRRLRCPRHRPRCRRSSRRRFRLNRPSPTKRSRRCRRSRRSRWAPRSRGPKHRSKRRCRSRCPTARRRAHNPKRLTPRTLPTTQPNFFHIAGLPGDMASPREMEARGRLKSTG